MRRSIFSAFLVSWLITVVAFCFRVAVAEETNQVSFVQLEDGRYILVLAPNQGVVCELRSFGATEVLDRVDIFDKYGGSTYRLQNVVGTSDPEVLAVESSGGSGTSHHRLIVLWVQGDKLVEIGTFTVKGLDAFSGEEFDRKFDGDVTFPESNVAIYEWTETTIVAGRRTTKHQRERFSFDGIRFKKSDE